MPIHVQTPEGKVLTEGEIKAINYWAAFKENMRKIYFIDPDCLPTYEFIFKPIEQICDHPSMDRNGNCRQCGEDIAQ